MVTVIHLPGSNQQSAPFEWSVGMVAIIAAEVWIAYVHSRGTGDKIFGIKNSCVCF